METETLSLNDRTLKILDQNGRVAWTGRPLGFPLQWIAAAPGGGVVVLFDYMAGPKNFANIARVRDDGSLAWQMGPPDRSSADAFVDASLSNDELRAHTWSGHLVLIDVATGRILRSSFVT